MFVQESTHPCECACDCMCNEGVGVTVKACEPGYERYVRVSVHKSAGQGTWGKGAILSCPHNWPSQGRQGPLLGTRPEASAHPREGPVPPHHVVSDR